MNDAASTTPVTSPGITGVVRLDDWGVIRARGADARRFLHGQLTQDVEHLESGHARLAGFCSPKGRLMASFVMWAHGEDVLLACSADLLPPVLKRLSMFVLRAQCKLTDVTADIPLWGLAGTDAARALGDNAPTAAWEQVGSSETDLIRLPDAWVADAAVPRWLLAGGTPPALPALDPITWQGLEAASGVARVVAATVEQFVPQMINFELVGGVNFKKGCYPGQEIVARSQYRGTLKRRAQVVLADVALQPGQEIFHDADPGQPAGLVVLAGSVPGIGPVALAELKLAALDSGMLHAGSAEGPLLRLGALPYALPADAP